MGIKTAVLGIGNILLSDEGVGVHALRALRERFTFPGGLEFIDGGTMGLDLLPFIEGNEALLIIDAVDFGKEPGWIDVIESADIKMFLDLKFSVHQIGLPEMLTAASLRDTLPPKLCLVGIQPKSLETSLDLSPAIASRMDALLGVIIKKLDDWGIESKEAEASNVSGSPIEGN